MLSFGQECGVPATLAEKRAIFEGTSLQRLEPMTGKARLENQVMDEGQIGVRSAARRSP
jgi:hypothetical protein